MSKKWKMQNGELISICDMENQHLLNTIKLIERVAKQDEEYILSHCSMFSGEHAQMHADFIYSDVYENGYDPNNVHPLYDDLVKEAIERGIL